METYHNKTIDETAAAFDTDTRKGLTVKIADLKLKNNGRNELRAKKSKSVIVKFFEQFNDFMIIVLIAAAAVSFVTSLISGDADVSEPVIILAIVVANAILGVTQEERAQKSLDALKKLSSPHARVLRSGNIITIDATEVVTGDILILGAGDLVAADCRLIEEHSLTVDESSLTGESAVVKKNADVIYDKFTPLAERRNMLFSSTSVTGGKGKAIVTATGMDTEVGQIACMLTADEREQTPLQKKLGETGKNLGIAALVICLIIFVVGLIKHLPPLDMFMTAVSLAVAAIPEGLPAIVTITLAIGVMKMSKRNAIVRNLPSVETLGGASVICSDKTGTLTQNKMTVSAVDSNNKELTLRLGAMCCDGESGNTNPTESAILRAAREHGFIKDSLDKKYKRVDEIPFDSNRKRMATQHRDIKGYKTIVKGAPELVIPLCDREIKDGDVIPLSPKGRRDILSKNTAMATDGLRVIAVCYRDDSNRVPISERNMIFMGLIGIEDPPRKESKEAVDICKGAGIRPVMITGDHAATALSIAKRVGIAHEGSEVITGSMLDKTDDDELKERIKTCSVFARVTPAHKVRLVKAFKEGDQIVAMTGDGVNDAPALKAADIGCSMGMSGTDVAKTASDMVLTDDNFATIVYAVKEGRGIFDNIKKSVKFLLSSNIGEIMTVFTGILFGWSSPLTAIQLLWVNLVTDSFPAIALGLDNAADDIMSRPPRDSGKGLFSGGMWPAIILEGMMIGALALLSFITGVKLFRSLTVGRTMAFATLSLSELIHAFNMRSEGSVIKAGLFKNIYLVLSFILGVILEVAVITIPQAASIFGVTPLGAAGWVIVALLSLMPLVIVEVQKRFNERLNKE